MKCPTPLPKEAQAPHLEALLAETPYVVLTKGKKEQKRREGLHTRGPSNARSEDTYASSICEEEEAKEDEGEGVSYPERKRASSKDAEEHNPPRAHRRRRKASVDQSASRPSHRAL